MRTVSSMSFGDISIDILFLPRDDGKSLPYEFVCDGDHGELSRLAKFSESHISVPALCVEAAPLRLMCPLMLTDVPDCS